MELIGYEIPSDTVDQLVGPRRKEYCEKDDYEKRLGVADSRVMGVVKVGGVVKSGMDKMVEEPRVWEALPLVCDVPDQYLRSFYGRCVPLWRQYPSDNMSSVRVVERGV